MDVRAGLGVVTVGVLAGEVLASRWPVWPASGLAAAALSGLVWCAWSRGRAGLRWAAVASAAFALGAARMASVTRPALPADHVARLELPLRTVLTARVVEAPVVRRERTTLVVEGETVEAGGAERPVSGRIRLAIRHPARRWRYGDRLRAPTTLRRPRNFANPGGFDYVGHLARRGLLVTGSVWDGAQAARRPGRTHGPRAWLERWRARVMARILATVRLPEGAVLAALVVGDEEAIDPALRDAFTRAGVVHVLSVSGLHVGLVAVATMGAARWLLSWWEWLLLTADVAKLAALASLVPVTLYAALAGLEVATLRSALMVVATVLAALGGRRVDVLRTLALAALVLGLVWPGTPLEIAFQLSFASVLAIVCGTRRLAPGPEPPRERGTAGWGTRIRAAGLVSPCALVGTAPLTAFYFHQVSLIGLVANPLAVPIFGSVAVGLGLAGAFAEPLSARVADGCFRAAGLVLVPGIALVRRLAAPEWAAVDVPVPSLLELALAYVALAGFLLLRRRGGRMLLVLALGGLLVDGGWWAGERFLRRELRVTFLDVGQGDAAVVELPGGGVLVVDAGGFPGGDFDTGAAVVGPFLWTRKILHVDAVVMTHAHPDHSGGLAYVVTHFRPREFWWTGVPGTGRAWEELQATIQATGVFVRVLTDGAVVPGFAWGTAVLHPADGGGRSLNESSLTLRIEHGGTSILLTGDIEAGAEQRLLANPGRLPSRVLKVPHHGSRTSSGGDFVDAVMPELAVISVGADNHYGLPAPEVERRYQARGTCVLRTDRCGAVTVRSDGTTLLVRTARAGCACPPPGD